MTETYLRVFWKSLLIGVISSFTFVACCPKNDPMNLELNRKQQVDEVLPWLREVEGISKVMTLDEILDIALTRNLDLYVREMEYMVQREKLTNETLKMLPLFNATKEVSWRTTKPISLNTTSTGATPTQSSSRRVNRWDNTGIWNVLDFGVSYYRSRQEQKKAVGLGFQYDRARQNIILDVYKSFWKGVTAKSAVEHSKELLKLTRQQIQRLESNLQDRNLSDFVALELSDKLLDYEAQLVQFEYEYEQSKEELAALMGISPCIPFELPDVEAALDVVEIGDVCDLEEVALMNRPELYSADMDQRILADEVRVAIISMFPPAAPFTGYNKDYDRFLVNHSWVIWGVRATWNLLSIPQRISDAKVASQRKQTSKATSMALSMGIIAQLHLAEIKYRDAVATYDLLKRIMDNKYRLYQSAKKALEYGDGNMDQVVGYQAEYVISRIEAMKAFSDAQVALEMVNNSLGIPFYFRSKSALAHAEE